MGTYVHSITKFYLQKLSILVMILCLPTPYICMATGEQECYSHFEPAPLRLAGGVAVLLAGGVAVLLAGGVAVLLDVGLAMLLAVGMLDVRHILRK